MRYLLLLSAAAALLAGCDRPTDSGNRTDAPAATATGGESEGTGRLDRSRAGTPAPDIAFEDPSGEPVRLADFRSKPTLVNFWATWCAPCVKEMPTLDALAARAGDKLDVVTISEDRDGRDKVEAFFDAHKLKTVDSYLDPEMALMPELGIDSLPTTILYDAEGREVWRFVGTMDWTGDEAAGLIAEAAGQT